MSKKSRRRNRKILGALAAGLGAMALMRGRGTPAAANVDSGRGGTSSSAAARVAANAVTGTEYPGANKVVDTAPKTNWISPRMTGHGGKGGVTGQNIRADYARRNRNAITGTEYPGANPYKVPVQPKGRLWTRTYKSGGRVKGVGKAKRGFGRALKGRK